jgi:hypothetical protein
MTPAEVDTEALWAQTLDSYYVGGGILSQYPICTTGRWKLSGARKSWELEGSLQEVILKVTSDYETYSDIIYHRSVTVEAVRIDQVDATKSGQLSTMRRRLECAEKRRQHWAHEASEARLALKRGV